MGLLRRVLFLQVVQGQRRKWNSESARTAREHLRRVQMSSHPISACFLSKPLLAFVTCSLTSRLHTTGLQVWRCCDSAFELQVDVRTRLFSEPWRSSCLVGTAFTFHFSVMLAATKCCQRSPCVILGSSGRSCGSQGSHRALPAKAVQAMYRCESNWAVQRSVVRSGPRRGHRDLPATAIYEDRQ